MKFLKILKAASVVLTVLVYVVDILKSQVDGALLQRDIKDSVDEALAARGL